MNLKPIHEQVVVIFGATSGIGLQTATMMAEQGARIALVGRNEHSVNQAVERVRQEARNARVMQSAEDRPYMSGGDMSTDMSADQQVIGLVADATRWEEVKTAADQAMAHFGRIDTWVQAAGVAEWALFEDTSPEEFRQVIDVNLTGMAYGAMAALPYLKQQQGGAIIFISSVAGRAPVPYQSAYSASKHGVVALSNVLRMEMKHEGLPISVTNILPSSINTPLFNKARTKIGVEPHPIPPVYTPELVAKAIIFAAQHPVREISVGGAGWLLQGVRRLSPALANAYMGTAAFEQQRSDQVKTAIAPDNLFSHTEGFDQIHGKYGMTTMRSSPQLWLATHPKARMALKAALLGGLGFAAYRVFQSQRHPSTWKQVQKGVKTQAKRVSQRLPDRISFRRKQSTMGNLLELLAGLPVVSMLPFFNKPSLRERVQQGIGSRVEYVSDHLPERISFRRKQNRFDSLLELLAGLPIVGMLPFFNKPTLRERVQRGVQHGVERIPVQETLHTTQKLLKRAQDRLPIEQTEKMVEKIQERMPRRRERVVKETTVEKVPEQVDVDVRVSTREARKAEKFTSRM